MNTEGQEVRDARVAGALYDGDWTVVGCDYTYLDNADLAPGESSTFEIIYADRDYEDVEYYHVQAEADWP